ncbi:pyruvate kinase [uncultured Tyzzerella sp.]|uniref:pyruvate kinase n=1 Tax=uncultured Tyzzerella sp. TaxID=2321398 RepID=UPI002942FB1A|nr:pyruvate kinase [uncultured Tyzzerella sp.]
MRKTKIIATLGPVSNSPEMVKKLIETGMNAVRINFSHGSHESHGETINTVKKVREELGLPIPLVLDTKGPEIRTKLLKEEPVKLEKGNKFILTTDDIEGDATKVSVTYEDFAKDLHVGATVLIDDGLIELKVLEINGNDVVCEIINSGMLGSRKGINLPNVSIKLPALTEKDIDDIKFGIKMGFDYIAASFIRSASDVLSIRKVLEENGGSDIKIISKIENREGVDNIDAILEVTDGIMVARGDLGVEIPFEEVPIIQKELIEKCKAKGKLVVTATQMLESMITNPRPTRAEASDVANAIYDGTDAIMLSGETAKGSFPVEAVNAMVRIATKIESSIDYIEKFYKNCGSKTSNITDAISHATCTTASDLNSPCIVAVTKSGFTVREVSKYRPKSLILGLTPDERVLRQLNLTWGCYPYLVDIDSISTGDLFQNTVKIANEKGFAKKGDVIVTVGGTPIGQTGSTNTLRAQTL